MREGLSDKTSTGRAGSFRGRRAEAMLHSTTVARFVTLHTPGHASQALGGPELPPSYTLTKTEPSWTGVRYEFEWGKEDGLRVELRTTLPGMLMVPKGRTLRLRFAFGNAPDAVIDLEKNRRLSYFNNKRTGRTLLLVGGKTPSLLAIQSIPKRWTVLSHEHLELEFDRPGVPVLYAPLLDELEKPPGKGMKAAVEILRGILVTPPLHCREEFEVKGRWVRIRQTFTDEDGRPASYAPVPPLWSILGSEGRLIKLPRSRHLMWTLTGPLKYVEGPSWEARIDSSWMDARVEAAREVKGNLPEPPKELSYAGDVTWDPNSPMDSLISLNTWAPLAGIAPEKVWRKVRKHLHVTSPSQLRRSLIEVDEPFLGRTYMKDRTIFDGRGEVSYDTDWYNGRMLAGMFRALRCTDGGIRKKAERLVRETKPERSALQAYMETAHDWALGVSWTDPRGEVWDLDCSHLGLGGVMAESKMRDWEGDAEGAGFSRYLAAKMAVAFIAAYPLGDLCRETGFLARRDEGLQLGPRGFRERQGASLTTPSIRSLGAIPPDFPEFLALMKKHGRVEGWRKMAEIWEREFPERYEDWLVFYTGRTKDRAVKSGRQEERLQAAVHYHLAPEIAVRLLLLEQDPDRIEALYGRPPSLAETLWLRSGLRLVTD